MSDTETTEHDKPKRPMCTNCPYYDAGRVGIVGTYLDQGSQNRTGSCLRMAPVVMVVCMSGGPVVYSGHPHVEPDHWCGQHPMIELLSQRKMMEALANGGTDMMLGLFDKVKGHLDP